MQSSWTDNDCIVQPCFLQCGCIMDALWMLRSAGGATLLVQSGWVLHRWSDGGLLLVGLPGCIASRNGFSSTVFISARPKKNAK